jgi:hypothetical protein
MTDVDADAEREIIEKMLADDRRRIEALTDARSQLLGVAFSGATDEGRYYLCLRSWDHPFVDDASIISLWYAYLSTTDDGSDGWTDDGVQMRCTADRAHFLQTLGQMFAGGIPRLDAGNDAGTYDLTDGAGGVNGSEGSR